MSVNETWPCQQLCFLTYETIISLTKPLRVPFFNGDRVVYLCLRVCVHACEAETLKNESCHHQLASYLKGASMLFCLGSLQASGGTNQSNKLDSNFQVYFNNGLRRRMQIPASISHSYLVTQIYFWERVRRPGKGGLLSFEKIRFHNVTHWKWSFHPFTTSKQVNNDKFK